METKPIQKFFTYKRRKIRLRQLKNGNWKAVAGGIFLTAMTEEEAIFFVKQQIDEGW